MIYENWL